LRRMEAAVYTYVPDRSLHRSQVETARARFGEEAFEAAWTEGRSLSTEQAIVHALDRSTTPESVPSETYPAGLSAREVEVLRLVATGLTNAEVAERGFLSRRTVEGPLGSIYRKLGLHSRAEATRFAVEHGLL